MSGVTPKRKSEFSILRYKFIFHIYLVYFQFIKMLIPFKAFSTPLFFRLVTV